MCIEYFEYYDESSGNLTSVIYCGSDLSVSLSGSVQATAGGTIQYSTVVKNEGKLAAENATLTLALPAELTYLSQTAPVEPTQQDHQLTWNLGTIEAGQQVALDVFAKVDASAAAGATLTSTATVATTSSEDHLNNNSSSIATTLVAAFGVTAEITPSTASLSTGGSTTYRIHLANSGLKTDTYHFSVSGLDAQWVTFTPDAISLTPGASAEVDLKVAVTACQADQTLSFSVSVTSSGTGQTSTLPGQLSLTNSPKVMLDAPGENSLSGSDSILFSWRTVPATHGTISVYPAGQSTQAQTFTFDTSDRHTVQVDHLTRNQAYEWVINSITDCGTSTETHHFSVGNGIVFTQRNWSFTKDRDYNQRVMVGVQNMDDKNPHTLTATVINPYEDLIVNFVDSGSTDQTITLQPGETKQVTLAIHAQDAKLSTYPLTAHLVADKDSSQPITDDANIDITLESEGNYTIEEDTAAYNPVTLARTFVVTNHGKTITDLSLNAVDPATGKPANIFLQPNVDHARLEKDQSIRVVAYPIFTAADANAQASISSPHLAALKNDGTVTEINFTLQGNGANKTVTAAATASCPSGKAIYQVTMSDCTMHFKTSDWYCTNRPKIKTPFDVPAFLNPNNITSVSLNLGFSPHDNVLSHSGKVSFNGQEVAAFTNAIPNGNFDIPIPKNSWNRGVAGLVTQNVEMDTQHNNPGHYISATNYSLDVAIREAMTYVCADTQAAAQQVAQQTYACDATASFNPQTDVYNGSTVNWGEIKKTVKDIAADNGYTVSAISCTQGDCGDPINTRTGVFSFASPDLSFPTSAGNLVFQRAYSSGTVDTYKDVLGYGWTHNQDARLIFPTDPGGMEGFVLYKDVLGNQYLFAIQADGSYKPGPGVLASLAKSAMIPVTYSLVTPEQAKLTFDEKGRILSRADAQGQAFEYRYNEQEKLARVSADQGTRYFDLGYDAQGRITSVTDYTGRQVTYTYNASGDLVSSTDLLGKTWNYTYDAAHHLTQVLDPSGKEMVRTDYDMNGRAYRQFDGEGNQMVRIVYHLDGSTTVYDAQGNAQTHVSNEHNLANEQVDELNHKTDTTYDANFRPTAITNAAGATLAMTWSTDGKNMLSRTDAAGNKTQNAYDELNNLVSTTDPLGNVTRYTYAGKLLTSKTDASGNTTTYTYTPEGYLAGETDSYGRTTTYTYDAHGQRTSVTDANGKVSRYTYDDLGRLTDTTDPRGRVTHNEYNPAGQLLKSTRNYDPARPQNDQEQYNLITTYEYDVRSNQISVTDTLGRVSRSEYDEAGRLVRTIDAAGNVTTNTYDEKGLLLSSKDPLGNTTQYVYDATGRRLGTIDALGQSSGTATFDVAANTSTAVDALGHAATYSYDGLNRVVKVVDPLGNFTTTTYDANGNVATRTDALGRVTRYEYDALNRLVRTTDPLGGITQTIYDAKGNRTASIDPLGNRTSYEYNDRGQLVRTTDPLGYQTTNEYDANGNLTATTDALGRVTRTEYDEWGRRVAGVDAAGRRTTYSYDALDRVISSTDSTGTSTTRYNALGEVISRTDVHGRTSTSSYDLLGRVTSATAFDGTTTTSEYDAGGNLISTTDGQGNTTRYTYDALKRRVATTDAQGHTSRVVYDVLGNVTDEVDAKGIVTHTVYDALNRKVSTLQNYRPAEQANAETNVQTDYSYNAVGNRTQVKDANGHVTTFEYDALNHVTKKIDPLGNTWQYTYDLAGQRISMIDGNGKPTRFSYDAGGHLTRIDYPDPDTDVTFTYDAAGQRTGMSDGLGSATWSYDALGRLTSATDANGKTVQYSYDAEGNRIGLVYPDGKQVAYQYTQDNRLEKVADWSSQNTDYEYDALGRLLAMLRPNGVNSTYTYDSTGKLTAIEHATIGGKLARYEYSYDADGNRVKAVEVGLPQTTPVTPTPTATNTTAPTSTPITPTVTETTAPTNTSVPPTATTVPTKTSIPPTATTVPTKTSVPPTATTVPTKTSVPPTATTVPTKTSVPPTATTAPTKTPIPPTITPTRTPTPRRGWLPLICKECNQTTARDPYPAPRSLRAPGSDTDANPYPAPQSVEADASLLNSAQGSGAYPAPDSVKTESKSLFQSALDFFRGLFQPEESMQAAESATITTTPTQPQATPLATGISPTPQATPLPEGSVEITYTYDALNRLTSAAYSNGLAFNYRYDAVGNVLEYRLTMNGQISTTTYTYDAANQLTSAAKDGVNWHYSYDGNGSLILSTPGDSPANGAKRYTYSTAGFLVKAETHNGTAWQNQAEMKYDGLGNRLEMVGFAEGQSVTTQYALDNGQVLLAAAGEQTTAYLYGNGVIGELTNAWAYSLLDGANTPRQMVDANGSVTLATSYTPWGDTLSVQGTGNFSFGYFGGVMDTATGLLYIGGGQYYDPETGRFISRNAKPGQVNPYVPWKADPSAALISPLLVLALVYGRKKKHSKWDILVIALVLYGAMGMCLAGCNNTSNSKQIPTSQLPTPIEVKVTATAATLRETENPQATPTPLKTPEERICHFVLVPNSTDMGKDWTITHYHYALENDEAFPVTNPDTGEYDYVSVGGLDAGKKYRRQFIYNVNKGIPLQGTGLAEDGNYITIDWDRTGKEVYPGKPNWWNETDPVNWFFKYGKGGRFSEGQAWSSIAVSDNELVRVGGLRAGDKVQIDGYCDIFTVTDTGSFQDEKHIDIFIGATSRAEALSWGKKTEVQVWKLKD